MRIKVSLSPNGIKQAQKQLAEYKAALKSRLEIFVKRLCEEGVDVARVRFDSAAYDGENDVTVDFNQRGTKATVYAAGKAVAFIEFGTGVSYAEHPSGMFAHGTYGKGKGKNPNGWTYKGKQGTSGKLVRDGVYRTKGNPPAMAMWSATEEMAMKVTTIWYEVMAGD